MIERIAGTFLTDDDSDYVFRALKLLSELLGKQGSRPTPRLEQVTAKIGKTVARTGVSGRKTDVIARNKGMQGDSGDDFGYALISSAEAANILGCTPGNVRDLRRRGASCRLGVPEAGGYIKRVMWCAAPNGERA